MKKYIMKLTANRCKTCNADYLIQKTEFTFYCNGCKTRYKKISKGSMLKLDKQVRHIPIDKEKIVLKTKKETPAPPKKELTDEMKKELWRIAKEQTLLEYKKILADSEISIDLKNEISDMLIQYHRFGSATQFSRKAIERYKSYLGEQKKTKNEPRTDQYTGYKNFTATTKRNQADKKQDALGLVGSLND